MLNDLFVLAKIKEGDVKAFEKIFRLYYSPLCLYAASITGNRDVAEEIVQELFSNAAFASSGCIVSKAGNIQRLLQPSLCRSKL